jgi:hypothetical protein
VHIVHCLDSKKKMNKAKAKALVHLVSCKGYISLSRCYLKTQAQQAVTSSPKMILDVFVRVSFLFPVGTKISVYERPAGLIQACRVKRPQSAAADVVLQTRPNQTKNIPPP